MRTLGFVSLLLMTAAVAAAAPHESRWSIVERPGAAITVVRTSATSLRLQVSETEQGLALLEDSTYVGVIEERLPVADVRVVRVRLLRVTPLPDGKLRVTLRNGWDAGAELVQTWLPTFGETALFGPLPPPSRDAVARVDHPAEPLQRTEPVYPEIAREAGVTGTVLLEALVDTDGRARDVRVKRSIPMLDAAAVACVKQWTFTPATRACECVASWYEVKVPFVLR